jgi:5-methylcytosine-specific restriction protein A
MPGWKGSNRRRELPDDWPARRARVLIRDHHRCQHVRTDTDRICGARANQVDHIRHGKPRDDRESNLQALCKFHHDQKSGREGGQASQQKRRDQTRRQEPLHPGVLSAPVRPPTTDHNDPSPF